MCSKIIGLIFFGVQWSNLTESLWSFQYWLLHQRVIELIFQQHFRQHFDWFLESTCSANLGKDRKGLLLQQDPSSESCSALQQPHVCCSRKCGLSAWLDPTDTMIAHSTNTHAALSLRGLLWTEHIPRPSLKPGSDSTNLYCAMKLLFCNLNGHGGR